MIGSTASAPIPHALQSSTAEWCMSDDRYRFRAAPQQQSEQVTPNSPHLLLEVSFRSVCSLCRRLASQDGKPLSEVLADMHKIYGVCMVAAVQAWICLIAVNRFAPRLTWTACHILCLYAYQNEIDSRARYDQASAKRTESADELK